MPTGGHIANRRFRRVRLSPLMQSGLATQDAEDWRARQIGFLLPDDLPRHFCPSQPEFSHAAAAFLAALPSLEPYFIRTVQEAAASIDDPELLQQIKMFNVQEARHAREHRAMNAWLARHYPELPRLERVIAERLDRSLKHDSLAYRLAYTSGYEAITYHLIGFMMEQRATWLADAEPHVFALLCWHGAEEVEHKSVAFDVFQRVCGNYRLRARGLADALVTTVKDLRGMMRYMLTVDGRWHQPDCRRAVRSLRLSFARGLLPRLLVYLRPSYHPSQYPDPPELQWWIDRYAAGDDLRSVSPTMLDGARARSTSTSR